MATLCSSQLVQILIKVSDISNEARPMEVSAPWIDCLLSEFFNQVSLCMGINIIYIYSVAGYFAIAKNQHEITEVKQVFKQYWHNKQNHDFESSHKWHMA